MELRPGNLFGIPVTGHAKEVSIWAFGPESGASALFTGSDYGVAASIVATILIVLLLWPAYRHYRRMEAQRAGTVIPAPAYSKGEPAPSEAPAA